MNKILLLNQFVKQQSFLLVIFCFLNACGFSLAQKKQWIDEAETVNIAKIENFSRIIGIDFDLQQELFYRIKTFSNLNYSENIGDLEIQIRILTASNFVSEKQQADKNYYLHKNNLTARLYLRDLRNLGEQNKNFLFSIQSELESREEVLDDAELSFLQKKSVAGLATQIFNFLTY